VRRRNVAEAIQLAKEQGDLTENAEYVDAKDEQGLVEQRIAELDAALKSVEVIRKETNDLVSVGDTVTVQWDGTEKTYMIVGPNEADPAEGRISNESPVGVALIGKRTGDIVTIRTPTGPREARIINIT
jgi:transcription elongation factor GreA